MVRLGDYFRFIKVPKNPIFKKLFGFEMAVARPIQGKWT